MTPGSSRFGTWEWDGPARRLTLDDGVAQLCGLAPGSFGGSLAEFIDLVHPADRKAVADLMLGPLPTDGPLSLEHRVQLSDGTVRWVLWAAEQSKGAQPPWPRSLRGIAVEITERKRTQSRQQRQSETLAILYRNAWELLACPACSRYETIARHLVQLCPGGLALASRFEPRASTARCRAAEGSGELVEATLAAFGAPLTDLRASVDEMSRTRYQTGRVLDGSSPLLETAAARLPREQRWQLQRRLEGARVLEAGLVESGQLRGMATLLLPAEARSPDRERLDGYLALAAHALGSDDGSARSGTETETPTSTRSASGEQRQLEEQLRIAHKREALGTLAGGIAHDFNNILHAILAHAQLARHAIPEPNPALTSLEGIVSACNRAGELVQQILTFTRKTPRERRPMLLQPVLKEALTLLRASLPATVEIRTSISKGCGPVLADAGQIHQIVVNLCTNANHAMRTQGGLLFIELHEELMHAEDDSVEQIRPGRYACLTVRDTGAGMPPEILERIFDPYFTTRKQGRGTGLGLATVHGIVEAHGGAITAESAPGLGSTFRVYFPLLASAEIPRQATAPVRPVPRLDGRVLFVDDERLIATACKQVLERAGCRVSVFSNGVEALKAFAAAPADYDLVITDQTMPGMTGVEMAKQMLELRPDLPIVLSTGYSETVNAESARGLGIREFAPKPMDMYELLAVVQRGLSGS